MAYIVVRIIRHVSGTHVWKIGRYHNIRHARGARNAAVEDDAEHWTKHSGPGGYVGIAPLWPQGMGLTLHAADGTPEAESVFTILPSPVSTRP